MSWRKIVTTMIYLFIYLTLLKAASGLHWIEGFLQDYSGMYQEALQKAQDYLKPPENTIDYHYILAAQVVAHSFPKYHQIPISLLLMLQLQPLNQVVPHYFLPRNVSLLHTLESTLGQKSTFYPKIHI